MKSFIYTYEERPQCNGATRKTVRIYRVKRNVPVHVCVGSDTYVSEFQLVMQTLEANKLLPPAAFERGPSHGHKYCAAYLLEEAGFAHINRVL